MEGDGLKDGGRPPKLAKEKPIESPPNPNPPQWRPERVAESLRVKTELSENYEPCKINEELHVKEEINGHELRKEEQHCEKPELRKTIRHWYPKCEAENIHVYEADFRDHRDVGTDSDDPRWHPNYGAGELGKENPHNPQWHQSRRSEKLCAEMERPDGRAMERNMYPEILRENRITQLTPIMGRRGMWDEHEVYPSRSYRSYALEKGYPENQSPPRRHEVDQRRSPDLFDSPPRHDSAYHTAVADRIDT